MLFPLMAYFILYAAVHLSLFVLLFMVVAELLAAFNKFLKVVIKW